MTDFNITWTGIDGSVWDLTSGTKGVRLSRGYSGLHLPAFTQQVSKAARVPGQRYLGTVYEARSIPLPVTVYGGVGDAWRSIDAAWWASLSPEIPGALAVTTTSAGTRSLSCRLGSAADPATDIHPGTRGVGTYALTLEADQPFWAGPDVVQNYAMPTTSQPYYGVSGSGPPFYISPANTLTDATISNPGDRPAYTRWTVTGPGTATFAIAGHQTTLPTLQAGQVVSIDTNPLNPNAVRDISGGGSVNWWPQMGAHDFWVPVPAYASGVSIPMGMTGGVVGQSSIQVSLTPLYSRAW